VRTSNRRLAAGQWIDMHQNFPWLSTIQTDPENKRRKIVVMHLIFLSVSTDLPGAALPYGFMG